MESSYEDGDKFSTPTRHQMLWAGRLALISVPLLFLGLWVFRVANWLLCDTHHIDIRVMPKPCDDRSSEESL